MSVRIDICLVIFRPRVDELLETLWGLSAVRDEFSCLRILVSGELSLLRTLEVLIDRVSLSNHVILRHRFDNIGFAAGQNLLIHDCFDSGGDFALAFNPDILVSPGGISRLCDSASHLPRHSLIGPWLGSREGGRRVFDSRGIEWTNSGRHFDVAAGTSWTTPVGEAVARVDGISGACLLVSSASHAKIVGRFDEFFDEQFIAYREDAELGVRASSVGVASYCVPSDDFSHRRAVGKGARSNSLVNMLSVQNRFLMRFKLRALYPGSPLAVLGRDIVVLIACLLKERTSVPGIRSAWRQRRSMRYKIRLEV